MNRHLEHLARRAEEAESYDALMDVFSAIANILEYNTRMTAGDEAVISELNVLSDTSFAIPLADGDEEALVERASSWAGHRQCHPTLLWALGKGRSAAIGGFLARQLHICNDRSALRQAVFSLANRCGYAWFETAGLKEKRCLIDRLDELTHSSDEELCEAAAQTVWHLRQWC